MGIVVTLITLLVVLLSGLTAGLGRGNTSAITDLPADYLVFSAPASGAKLAFTDSSIPPSVQASWSRVPGVQRADPVTVAMTRAGVGGRTAGVALFAVPSGSPLAPGLASGRVVLSTKAAKALEVAVGDHLDVAGQSVTIAAVSGDDEFSHAPVIWAVTTNAPSSGQKPGEATFLALTTDSDSAALAAADQRLGTTTLTPAQSLSAIGSYTSENGSLQLMRALLFAISALVIGAFFTVWTVQRSGEIAILKALGASTRYLLKDALGQALALLALGTALGAGLAAGIGAAITTLAGTAVPFVLNLPTLLLPAVVMIVLGLAGAAVSLRTVTTVDPLTALGSAR
ncbi:ABC transporter substrate-binding protein [Terrabacter tumescens]|uniref:ABC transporter substrate-binding protein n=1 Tax=Terrabacter tumescens TaxID=60443 RepID=A0ABQ2HXI5_9MICO|nr:ABC transporter permease [Terrabacter tumescens]GGM94550.1 ABC transporter substrate-binding protein [Terrabacter tumescens]